MHWSSNRENVKPEVLFLFVNDSHLCLLFKQKQNFWHVLYQKIYNKWIQILTTLHSFDLQKLLIYFHDDSDTKENYLRQAYKKARLIFTLNKLLHLWLKLKLLTTIVYKSTYFYQEVKQVWWPTGSNISSTWDEAFKEKR